jgi:hypothetical protein
MTCILYWHVYYVVWYCMTQSENWLPTFGGTGYIYWYYICDKWEIKLHLLFWRVCWYNVNCRTRTLPVCVEHTKGRQALINRRNHFSDSSFPITIDHTHIHALQHGSKVGYICLSVWDLNSRRSVSDSTVRPCSFLSPVVANSDETSYMALLLLRIILRRGILGLEVNSLF